MAVVGEGFWGQRRRENVARHPVAISRPQHHLQVTGSLYGKQAHVHRGLRSARIIEFVHVSDVGCRLFLLILLLWARWQSIPGHLSRLPCSANQDDRGHVFGCPGSAVHVALGAQIRLPWGRSSGSTVSVARRPGSDGLIDHIQRRYMHFAGARQVWPGTRLTQVSVFTESRGIVARGRPRTGKRLGWR